MNIVTESKILLEEVIIENYPSSIKVANKIAIKPFVLLPSTKRGKKVKSKEDLPKKYQTDDYEFDKSGFLINKHTKEKIASNPIKQGQERWWVVNFQDIWNQNVTTQARAARTEILKNILIPYLNKIKVFNIEDYPLEINLFILDHQMPVDVSNKGVVYIKVIEDTLKFLNKIVDDKAEYVNCSGRTKFIKISKEETPKMIIRVYKSNNQMLSNDKIEE